jgi:putative membrane protein
VSLATLLPAWNASLNTLCAVLLTLGLRAIRAGARERHRRLMIAAVAVSAVFLTSYLARVALTGTHRFPGDGPLRWGYLVLLLSHTTLAVAAAPMALRTLFLGWTARFDAHRRLARITLPVWLYVSVTGVLVYLMLYQVAPRLTWG